MEQWIYDEKCLRLLEGTIVELEVDAVVNAANKSLILGGGVAGAIRSAGGPSIQAECNRLGPIEVGEAVVTGAGNMKARYVIHAAGPVYGEGDEENKLARATLNSLRIAGKKHLDSIAFPAISTGIFHFPVKRCASTMLKTAADFMKAERYPRTIIFCLYDPQTYAIFSEERSRLAASFPGE
jgi:O-acetyl-ADP-ribose deacetylase (regulator of RNase III)